MAELVRPIQPEACIDIKKVAPDYEAQALEASNRPTSLLAYLLIGIFFGIVLIKSEVASWFRIQEMFRFQSFHMYGVIGSAVVVAAVSVQLIKRLRLKTIHGSLIELQPKVWGKGVRYWLGGILFGLGWGLLGACPGPMFALLGSGVTVMVVGIISAMLGTWAYAALRPRLPH